MTTNARWAIGCITGATRHVLQEGTLDDVFTVAEELGRLSTILHKASANEEARRYAKDIATMLKEMS